MSELMNAISPLLVFMGGYLIASGSQSSRIKELEFHLQLKGNLLDKYVELCDRKEREIETRKHTN